ncbi:serine hydrolase domain-containing protein [Streptomyces profundus]|uniref:serine hydrolase domain-containing protein n=1 Tax=Streptomyces profundus TaxID=2867410 RepID=UPI001D164ECB|nr:serine hydrolase domain-containing protein [Streptomyces sp. MA3_2.13]UED83904.1 beta-lactamase family protein [Streptomyces sp. MA3_2.13]
MRRILIALLAVAALTGCSSASDSDSDTDDGAHSAGPADGSAVGHDNSRSCAQELDEALGAWADAGFSGSVALATGGEPDCVASYGQALDDPPTPNTPDTVFAIGSVSKSFTAAAVLQLAGEGALSLDERAGSLVPGLGGPAADATVEQLLLHTSGLTGTHGEDHVPLDREEAVAAISRLERAFEPGTDFLYSNGGYTLLALIIEELTDEGHREFLASRILPLPEGGSAGGFWDGEPAAPEPRARGRLADGPSEQVGAFAGPHWALAGNGDLAMTATELASWTHALFTGQVVPPEWAEVIATPGWVGEDGTAETPGWVALDEAAFGAPVLAVAGGGSATGHHAVAVWLPESRRSLAITSNSAEITAEELARAVGPALLADEPPPLPEGQAADVPPAELAAVEGAYALASGGVLDVVAEGSGLSVSAHGPDAVSALFPPTGGFTADELRAHEDRVRALWAGESQEGREEREALESEFGPIDAIAVDGTLVDGGEPRTYVTLSVGDDSVTLWYALDEAGGIAGVEGPVAAPALPLVPVGGGEFRPDDPTGDRSEPSVAFDEGTMTLSGPAGVTTAETAD